MIRHNPNRPMLNRAFDGLYEPGSIAKIMTAAAALEARVDMSRIFPMVPQTAIDLDGKIFRDWENHGKLRSLKEAMDVSSNVALFKVDMSSSSEILVLIWRSTPNDLASSSTSRFSMLRAIYLTPYLPSKIT